MRKLGIADILLFFVLSLLAPVSMAQSSLAERLQSQAPELNAAVLDRALRALHCAQSSNASQSRLAVIDYSLPSTEKRLWVFDLAQTKLMFRDWVAHGRASGNTWTESFSNTPGSHQSSIGLFKTLQAYDGRNGYSLRMQGLEPGYNHHAFERAIVIHGADYVSAEFIERTGRIGRSHGCPAVRSDLAAPLIDAIKDGHYLYADYPDQTYRQQSRLLNCPTEMASLSPQ